MAASSRVYGGFGPVPFGMNGGIAASLLTAGQYAQGVNCSIRGSYVTGRPSWRQHALTFADAQAQANFKGVFQGSEFYQSDFGTDGWVVAMGGRLFFISTAYAVSEITPKVIIVTRADFVVPAVGNQVNILVNSETPIAVGDTLFIDFGEYVVVNRFTDGIIAAYAGGGPNPTVLSGAAVLDSQRNHILEYETNPEDYDFVHMFQAEFYMIILGGQHKTVIFDGTLSRQAKEDEVPPGIIGCYGWGRIWIVLDDQRSFVAGNLCFDVQGGGTAQNNFRDSILKFTENDFLNEGGTFGVPVNAGLITALQFLATQDTSLGVGVLLVGTDGGSVFSVNAPADRTLWKNLRYPIQTVSLLGSGPKGPRSAVGVNQDMWFRSKEGIRSFIVARRNMQAPGNTPMSLEIAGVLNKDTKQLLFYGSGLYFDNRLIMTCSPLRTATGVHHMGLASLNFDAVSTMRDKLPPAWEGFWSGLNIYNLNQGTIDNIDRAFAFVKGTSGLELWELLPEDGGTADENENVINGVRTLCRTPLQWSIDSAADNHGDADQLKQLVMGTLFVDEITDNVTITVKFRPDQYPAYVTWKTIHLCATVAQCAPPTPGQFSCTIWQANAKQYASRLTLPQPPNICATLKNVPVNLGREFQYRLEITGRCTIRMFRAHAVPQTQEMEGVCPADVQCQAFAHCDLPIFNFDAHGTCQTGGITTYHNTRQCQTAYCPQGQTGNPVQVCIDGGTYSSTVSQADADGKALAAALQQATAQLSCAGPMPCTNFAPVMSSPSNADGTASASTENAIAPAWKAFDRKLGTLNRWKSAAVPPQWVRIQITVGKICRAYRVYTVATAWQFQGSTDGSGWTTLDTQTGQVVSPTVGGLYLISNSTSYTYYRLLLTADGSGGTTGFVDVTELQLFDCQTPS